ncbi:MAG: selenide, water dikinase SelD, partial [Deltaproteobacteria bacterium]|nr:selenide, water dikinase SelD [Deltaproteobacteria bacterium]
EGGLDVLREAGVALVGGHSVEDDEPKYGLAVTGLVHPERVMTNSGLKRGDTLILTKAVGTGVIATAAKARLASDSSVDAMVASMCSLNVRASELASRFGLRACTDVSGFGLVGHLVEMARASSCRIRIQAKAVPILQGALDAARMGLVPGGTRANMRFFGQWVSIARELPAEVVDLMFDPQTSGGLILGVPPEQVDEFVQALLDTGVGIAASIGTVLEQHPDGFVEIV